ncbi:MAG: phosphoribosylamine--glycine ligase [Armatimonadota bacterium]
MRDKDLNVLVVGSGGREHALAAKLAESDLVRSVICAPGNAGMEEIGRCVPVGVRDTDALLDLASQEKVDLVVCGPESPLIAGLGDAFLEAGIPFFGPLAYGARLEGSKIFAKEVMREAGVPTAQWEAFDSPEPALEAAKARLERDGGVVIKADGEAAGKGVFVCSTEDEARKALSAIMVDRVFGSSGDRVLVEERLEGEEASVMVLATGEKILPMPPVQDHKRAYDGDQGPNTGGMGCYSPVPVMPPELHREAIERTVLPVLQWMDVKGQPYFGCLYAGLMITKDGLKVLEYNCRFGDPETQVVLPMMRTDFGQVLVAAVGNRLDEIRPEWYNGCGVCVVLASGGYPGSYQTGFPISGLDAAAAMEGVCVFHAGTARRDGEVVTAGGRVLGVTALGSGFREARERAYQACSAISFEKMHYRKDIGARLT